ncbi:MAG: ATP-binding cassette domain-containing protein [Chloroflexota bacterium]
MTAAVVVQNATKQYRRPTPVSSWQGRTATLGQATAVSVLNQVSLAIGVGEIFGVVGPEGAGKSTLVHLLAGQSLPDSGQVVLFGWDTGRHAGQVRRLVNRVSGEASFFRRLSAFENLVLSAQQAGVGGHEARRQVLETLQRLGFDEYALHLPRGQLSRSQQALVGIARALAPCPPLLVLDEPLRDLEPTARRRVLELITDLRAGHQVTVVIATRDWVEAALFCDRIALLENGELLAVHTLRSPGPVLAAASLDPAAAAAARELEMIG